MSEITPLAVGLLGGGGLLGILSFLAGIPWLRRRILAELAAQEVATQATKDTTQANAAKVVTDSALAVLRDAVAASERHKLSAEQAWTQVDKLEDRVAVLRGKIDSLVSRLEEAEVRVAELTADNASLRRQLNRQ